MTRAEANASAGVDRAGAGLRRAAVGRVARETAEGVWFGDQQRPALGWLSRPPAGTSASGVLIAPPVGYPYWGSHRTLRVLAQQLAASGHVVLRIDYDGTGDSAGDQWEPGRLAAWRRTVADGAALLREAGATRLTLAGARLGATIALSDGRALGADAVVAWMPVVSGRRYAKELLLLSRAVPADHDPLDPPGTRVVAGNVFSAQTVAELRGIGIEQIREPPADRVLVLDDLAGACAEAVAHLRAIGTDVSHVQLAGGELALEQAPEYATVPMEHVSAVVDWLPKPGTAATGAGAAPLGRPAATMRWRGTEIEERVVTLKPDGHVAIVTSPVRPVPGAATLVALNPGSETHVGPGRAWVELARELALAGRRTVRVDFLGWGESPDAGRAPGRPYDQACVADTVSILGELGEAGYGPLVPFGLCASAWIALRAVLEAPVAGVIALNPQLYWKPGDLVEIDWDLIRADRAREIVRIERGARIGAWTVLDVLGHRPRAARWLTRLARTGVPVHLLFSEGDDGLKFLRERLGRRLAHLCRPGSLTVAELPEIDHPMHLSWLRGRVVRAVSDALEEIDRGAASAPARGDVRRSIAVRSFS